MLADGDRETVEDRSDLLKSIAKSKHKDIRLLSCDILETEPNVKEFKIVLRMSQESYSECINKFLDVRNKRLERILKKLNVRELRKGEDIECPEDEKISKKQKLSI